MVRADAGLVVSHCPANVMQDGKGSVFYLLTGLLVPDRADRLLFNKLLNGLIGSNLDICVGCEREVYRRTLEKFLSSVDLQRKRKFLATVFELKDSTAWADGNATGAYQILMSNFAQPEGAVFVNRALRDAARSCDLSKLDEAVVSEVVLLDPPRLGCTLRLLARCPCDEKSVGLLLVTAIGLAHGGHQEAGSGVLGRVGSYAQDHKLDSLSETVKTIKGSLSSLPNEPESLRKLIIDWLQLPI